jgi:hypothetical protein
MSMTVRLNPMTNSPAYSTLAGSSACASTQQAETAQRSIVAIKRARWDTQESFPRLLLHGIRDTGTTSY